MIDIFSISYPAGAKHYINVNDGAPEILRYLYEHRELITCKLICDALNLPTKKTAPILTNLVNYGILDRQTILHTRSAGVYGYRLRPAYHIKFSETEGKEQQTSPAEGGVAA